MDVPVIRVEDCSVSPPVARRYILGENDIDVKSVYVAITELPDHPGRGGHIITTTEDGPGRQLKQCSQEFLNTLWECVARLLDYFADFLDSDTVPMRRTWFGLLDTVQECAHLPHYGGGFLSCDHAAEFVMDWDRTVEIFNEVINRNLKPTEPLVRTNTSLSIPVTQWLGPFKAGLRSWEQFLCHDAPGFQVPMENQRIPAGSGYRTPDNTFQRHVPMGGLAIIDQHTKLMRKIVAKQARENPDDGTEAEKLAEFDQNTLKLNQPYSFPSITGGQITTQPMHPHSPCAGVPRRLTGWSDPSMDHASPSLALLDESLGMHKGARPYNSPNGPDIFQMLSFSETPGNASTENEGADVDLSEWNTLFTNFVGSEYHGLED